MTNSNLIEQNYPQKIRVSIGSAAVLDLITCKLDVFPKTAHLMTYYSGRCTANCSFCPQARNSSSKSFLLSRVSWPDFPTQKVMANIKKTYLKRVIHRVCIQALNYSKVFNHLTSLVRLMRKYSKIPISISCQPQNDKDLILLANAGVDRIGIPIDAATKSLFNDIKGKNVDGPYKWENQFSKLTKAVRIFGKGKVSTHLIVGLGESEQDILNIVQTLFDLGVISALFAFTPIRGTKLESRNQPSIKSYRKIQFAKYLIENRLVRFEEMSFNNNQLIDYGIKNSIIREIIETGDPFLTSGCPNCNRPFYNEKPSGPLFNFPHVLNSFEITKIKQLLGIE